MHLILLAPSKLRSEVYLKRSNADYANNITWKKK